MNGGSRLPEQAHVEAGSRHLNLETSQERRLAVGALAVVELAVLTLGAKQIDPPQSSVEPQPVVLQAEPYHLPYEAPQHHAKSHHEPAPTKTVVIKPAPKVTPAVSPLGHAARGYTAAVDRANVHPHHGHHPQKRRNPHVTEAEPKLLFGSGIAADISWPKNNCHVLIPDFVTSGRVGLNSGNNFTSNSCLTKEVAKFGSLPTSLYVNSGFHSKEYVFNQKPVIKQDCHVHETAVCAAHDWGYRAGLYDIKRAVNKHVYEPNIAIDVEGQTPKWSKNYAANVASLKGEIAGLRAGARRRELVVPKLVFYYAPYGWGEITNGWQDKSIPVWLAHGHVSQAEAQAACNNQDPVYHTRSGGVLAGIQFVIDGLRVAVPHHKHQWKVEDLDLTEPCLAS